jgi:hypothetical protein
MSCDDLWISLRAEVLACEAAYTYILFRSLKGALSRRFESFRPINVVPDDEALVEDKYTKSLRPFGR